MEPKLFLQQQPEGYFYFLGGILLPAAEIQTTNFYYHGGCMPPRGWGYPNVLSILHLQDLNAGQCGEGGAGGDAGALCAAGATKEPMSQSSV